MDSERTELELLFEALFQGYGYDFRDYLYGTARRRVLYRMHLEGFKSISELHRRVLSDQATATTLLRDLSIGVTEMFRDPPFYLALRELVLPELARYEHLKIWHAGCASGEEVYSMAILLAESDIYGKSQLYATDFNDDALDQAKRGIFQIGKMRSYVANYHDSGGRDQFTEYYHARYDGAVMDAALKANLQFAHHDLATDTSFGEMQMVVCRNVLIYFNRDLQERVFQLFSESICEGGFLCLGSHETLDASPQMKRFDTVSSEHRIYRKLAPTAFP